MSLSPAQKKFALDTTATLVVSHLAHKQNIDPSSFIPTFLSSKTGQMLFDEPSKLWWEGPAYIEEMYAREKANLPPIIEE